MGNLVDSNERKNAFRWEALFAKRLEDESKRVFEYYRSYGIEPVLIKGWAAGRCYPKEHVRLYSDIDIAVSAEDFIHAEKLRTSETGSRLRIDLHCELRHLDTKPFAEIFRDSLLVELDAYPIRIPAPEDNLRILAAHWLNDGGESREKLWDIFYAVANRPLNFSWEKCLEQVNIDRRSWVIAAIGAAHKYLGLEIDDFPFADECRNLPKWFTDTLESEWKSGVRLVPLTLAKRDRKQFLLQIRKRLPPNPIQSTIEGGGSLLCDLDRTYQALAIYRRTVTSLYKFALSLKSKWTRPKTD